MTSEQIVTYMAFDRLKDESYRKQIKSEAMTEEERNLALMRLFGGA